MKNRLYRFAALLLVFACILPLGSCGNDIGDVTDNTTEAKVPGPDFVKDGALVYTKLVRSSDASADLVTAATALYKQIQTLTGLKPSYEEDFLTRNTADNDNFEILIGATNRPESSEKLAELSSKDWYIGLSGNKLLIIGGSDSATIDALDSFSTQLAAAFEGKAEGTDATLDFMSTALEHKGEYTGHDINIAGTPMSQFTVVYNTTSDCKTVKEYILTNFADGCGKTLSSTIPSTEAVASEIVVGSVSSRADSVTFADGGSGTVPYAINCKGGKLYLSGKTSWGLTYAGIRLIELVNAGTDIAEGFSESGDAAGKTLFSLSEGADIRIMSNNVWKCDSNQAAWKAIGEDCSATVRSVGFAAIYAAFKPDIINLQEMSTVMLHLVKQKLVDAGHNYKALTYSTTEQDDTPILYNADTLKMIDNGHHLYAYGNNSNTKGYHWALFEHLATGTQFIDLSTHLWWKSESAQTGSDSWRTQQAQEIVALSEKLIAQYNVPMIIMGDLNTTTGSEAYKALLNGDFEDCHDIAKAKDSTRGHHKCSSEGFSTELYSGNYTDNAIDHALIKNKGDWQILCFRQPTTDFFWKLTDHVPIYVDISFGS